MPPRSDIEATDRPTVLSILYSTVSAHQTKLLSENVSQNNTIFPKSLYCIYQTTSQCLSPMVAQSPYYTTQIDSQTHRMFNTNQWFSLSC